MAAWRGRPFDVTVLYLQHDTWDEMAFKTYAALIEYESHFIMSSAEE